MSKCENCIHYDRCDHYHIATDTGEYAYQNIDLEKREDVEDICDDFKSKSLFVELPCRCKDCEFFAIEKIDDNEEYICKHRGGMVDIDKDSYCSEAKLKEMENLK